jgi:hypothetical protein
VLPTNLAKESTRTNVPFGHTLLPVIVALSFTPKYPLAKTLASFTPLLFFGLICQHPAICNMFVPEAKDQQWCGGFCAKNCGRKNGGN